MRALLACLNARNQVETLALEFDVESHAKVKEILLQMGLRILVRRCTQASYTGSKYPRACDIVLQVSPTPFLLRMLDAPSTKHQSLQTNHLSFGTRVN